LADLFSAATETTWPLSLEREAPGVVVGKESANEVGAWLHSGDPKRLEAAARAMRGAREIRNKL
jgi:hypothetical protein